MNTLNFERFIANEALAARDAIQSGVAKLRDEFLMKIEILKAQRIAEQCTDQMEEFLETIAYVYDMTGVIPELVEQVSHFDEVSDMTDLNEQVRIEAERDLFGWLGIVHGSEPTESSTATAAAYGDLDIAEWNAQHADWLDEKRTQEEARW